MAEGSTRNGVNLRAWYLEGAVYCHNRGSKQRSIVSSGNSQPIFWLAVLLVVNSLLAWDARKSWLGALGTCSGFLANDSVEQVQQVEFMKRLVQLLTNSCWVGAAGGSKLSHHQGFEHL